MEIQVNFVRIERPKYLSGNRPFKDLPLKQRAIFILHLAGFTQTEISQVVSEYSQPTVSREISRSYEKLASRSE